MRRDTTLGKAIHVEFAPAGTAAAPAYSPDSSVPPTPRQLRPLLASHGATGTADLLRRLHRTHPDAPVFHSTCGFALVFELVARGRIDAAREVGAVWRDLVPEFTRELDVIARWYADEGSTEFASACLEALLVVDPENDGARRRLSELRGE